MDGRRINNPEKGCYQQFYVAGRFCELDIRVWRFPTRYNLYIEGKHVETGLSRAETNAKCAECMVIMLCVFLALVFNLLALVVWLYVLHRVTGLRVLCG